MHPQTFAVHQAKGDAAYQPEALRASKRLRVEPGAQLTLTVMQLSHTRSKQPCGQALATRCSP